MTASPATGTAFDHLFKIVLVGDSGVGSWPLCAELRILKPVLASL